jgi:tyrosyl-tRNA synthetase
VDLLADLEARGLVHDTTDREALAARLAEGPLTLYCGFDPTGASLGWWHLQNLVTLRRFQEAGHKPIALAGGATGMIGDPSGRSEERVLLDEETLAANLAGITADMGRVLSFDGPAAAKVVDNAAWTAPLRLLDFLRDIGKHVTINQMVGKESVRARMEGDSGISFTEFAYMLLQGHDYLWLHEHEGCELQIGASDQWGNIVVGIDLIRRKAGAAVHGLTSPLLLDASGAKLGKSTGGTVFLNPKLTSPYQFFQHWMQTEDEAVGDLLRRFSLLPVGEIAEIEHRHAEQPERREGQRVLARQVTALVHGESEAAAAEAASEVLFGATVADAGAEVFAALAGEVPTTVVSSAELADGIDLVGLAAKCFDESTSAVRRALGQGGLYVNNERVDGDAPMLTARDARGERFVLLRLGKRRYHLVQAG